MIYPLTCLSFFRYDDLRPCSMRRFSMTPVRRCNPGRVALAAGFALAASTIAVSPGSASYERARQMCMGDAMRLCSSELPSIARITACMRRNKASVSAGCRAVMDEMEGAAAAKAKPAQTAAAPAAPKPPPVARVQPPAPPRPVVQAAPVAPKPAAPPPVAAAPVARLAAVEAKPVPAVPLEQKPVAVTPLRSLAWSDMKSAQPVEAAPANALLAQAGAAETPAPAALPQQNLSLIHI